MNTILKLIGSETLAKLDYFNSSELVGAKYLFGVCLLKVMTEQYSGLWEEIQSMINACNFNTYLYQ